MDLNDNSSRARQQLADFGKLFEPRLRSFLNQKIKEAEGLHPLCREMALRLADFTLSGGKRIRPAFVYYAFRCFSNEKDPRIFTAAIAPELLHSFLLIHDDIIDADEMRRNAPSMHVSYKQSPHAKKFKSEADFGEAMAIITGDVACAMAFDSLAASGFDPERLLSAIHCLSRALMDVGYGEALDIYSCCSESFSEEDAVLVNRMKTGRYTIEVPLHIGAILAGAPESSLKALSAYAEPLGQAFQMQDDILGLFGKPEQTGKPAGSDLEEGKRTLLILEALKSANPADKELIENALGKQGSAESLLPEVQQAVLRSGALDRVRNAAANLVEEAKSALDESLLDEGREFLAGIADYMVNRDV